MANNGKNKNAKSQFTVVISLVAGTVVIILTVVLSDSQSLVVLLNQFSQELKIVVISSAFLALIEHKN